MARLDVGGPKVTMKLNETRMEGYMGWTGREGGNSSVATGKEIKMNGERETRDVPLKRGGCTGWEGMAQTDTYHQHITFVFSFGIKPFFLFF